MQASSEICGRMKVAAEFRVTALVSGQKFTGMAFQMCIFEQEMTADIFFFRDGLGLQSILYMFTRMFRCNYIYFCPP